MEDALLDRLNAAAAGEIVWDWFGGGVPVQGRGRTRDGEEVYFRFRHNGAQLYVGDYDRDDTRLYCELYDIYTHPDGTPDDLRGVFESDDEAVELVERMRAGLKPTVGSAATRVDRGRAHLLAVHDHLAKDRP